MDDLYKNPTLEKAQGKQIDEIGPSICKKNLQRNGRYPTRCMCSSGYTWPGCREYNYGSLLTGFELVDE